MNSCEKILLDILCLNAVQSKERARFFASIYFDYNPQFIETALIVIDNVPTPTGPLTQEKKIEIRKAMIVKCDNYIIEGLKMG